jgi:hypothetical protein
VCRTIAILIVSVVPVLATTTDRVVVRDTVSQRHREELANRLRAITGWSELKFDADGVLQLSGAARVDGSASARNLLSRAVSGSRVMLLEDASSRKDVVFCRVVLGKLLQESLSNSEIHVILIDFDDFRQVSGDKQARAAFDVGWAVLHEIDHVVVDSQDPQRDTSAGDCEGHINKMRRELGLPVRSSYFFSLLPVNNDGVLISRFVRLGFHHTNGSAAKTKRYWLIWDAAVVGGLETQTVAAEYPIRTIGVRSLSWLSTSQTF